MLEMIQPVGDLPLDAIAFCDLIARILYRCLRDQETRMLLFPTASEHHSTVSPRENGQDVREMSHT